MENKKPITIAIIVLILAVTAFLLVRLFGKELSGTKNPPDKTEQVDQAALEKEKNRKEIEEKMALVEQGFSDALDGEIVGFSADKKTIQVKPDESEQLDEQKIIDVIISDETEILRLGYDLVPSADNEDEPFTAKAKTEKLGIDDLREGMLIQAATGKMLDLRKESSILAIRVTTSDQAPQGSN